MKELSNIIYIQKILHVFNERYYIKDNDLSFLFEIDINQLIKKDKLLKELCIKIGNNYYLDNECIIYLVNLLNTNKSLIIYKNIIKAFKLIIKYSSLTSIKI